MPSSFPLQSGENGCIKLYAAFMDLIQVYDCFERSVWDTSLLPEDVCLPSTNNSKHVLIRTSGWDSQQ